MRRAKIVATLGPATSSLEQIRGLVAAGMDVARLNLSHGSHDVHLAVYNNVRAAADEAGRGVGILVDLQGPKIRLGRFASGPVLLENGAEFIVTTDDVPGDGQMVSTTYSGLPQDVTVGDLVLVDDGRVELKVTKVEGNNVHTVVVEGGRVSDNKGFNLPGVAVSVPALSEKDRDDLRWALRTGADLIALSFVRSAADVADVHEIMDEEGVRLPVLAKVEKPQAIENLEEIIAAFDGVMVARGDLGVELPLEAVPLVQKRAIHLCREAGKPVIVATQMLDSMAVANRPTRAEASDVANAVLDGADALMLSGETSVGDHPNLVVETMSRIIEHVETWALHQLPSAVRPVDRLDGPCPDARGGRRRRGRRRHAPDRLHRDGLVRPPDRPLAAPHAAARVHAEPAGPQPAVARVGRRDLPGAERRAHRRHGGPGRQGAARDRPRHLRRPGRHRGRRAARRARHHERHARAQDGQRGEVQRRRLTTPVCPGIRDQPARMAR